MPYKAFPCFIPNNQSYVCANWIELRLYIFRVVRALWFCVLSHLYRVFMKGLFCIWCYFHLNSHYVSKAKISYKKFRTCGVGVEFVHCCPWFLSEHVQDVHRPHQNMTCAKSVWVPVYLVTVHVAHYRFAMLWGRLQLTWSLRNHHKHNHSHQSTRVEVCLIREMSV